MIATGTLATGFTPVVSDTEHDCRRQERRVEPDALQLFPDRHRARGQPLVGAEGKDGAEELEADPHDDGEDRGHAECLSPVGSADRVQDDAEKGAHAEGHRQRPKGRPGIEEFPGRHESPPSRAELRRVASSEENERSSRLVRLLERDEVPRSGHRHETHPRRAARDGRHRLGVGWRRDHVLVADDDEKRLLPEGQRLEAFVAHGEACEVGHGGFGRGLEDHRAGRFLGGAAPRPAREELRQHRRERRPDAVLAEGLDGFPALCAARVVVRGGLRVEEREAQEPVALARSVPLQELEGHVAAHREAREDERFAPWQRAGDLFGDVVGEKRHRVHTCRGAEGSPAPAEVGGEDGRDRAEGARRRARSQWAPDPVVQRIAVERDEVHGAIHLSGTSGGLFARKARPAGARLLRFPISRSGTARFAIIRSRSDRSAPRKGRVRRSRFEEPATSRASRSSLFRKNQ